MTARYTCYVESLQESPFNRIHMFKLANGHTDRQSCCSLRRQGTEAYEMFAINRAATAYHQAAVPGGAHDQIFRVEPTSRFFCTRVVLDAVDLIRDVF